MDSIEIVWNGIPLTVEYEWSPETSEGDEYFNIWEVFTEDGSDLLKYLNKDAQDSIIAECKKTAAKQRAEA